MRLKSTSSTEKLHNICCVCFARLHKMLPNTAASVERLQLHTTAIFASCGTMTARIEFTTAWIVAYAEEAKDLARTTSTAR